MYKRKRKEGRSYQKAAVHLTMMIVIMGLSITLYAQNGAAGIEQANQQVRGYFDVGCNLMYAIGAVLGLVGAIKVYQKWQHGHPDTGSTAAAWFGSCIFLVVVATVLKSFFWPLNIIYGKQRIWS